MAEKYEDLYGPMINDETFDLTMTERMGAKITLQWLDEHPDRVPGRTMTESEMEHKCATYGSAYETGFRQAGGVVIPDPEPTNVEKLKAVLDAIGDSTDGYREHLASRLDDAGVKAPGDDDD